MLRSNVIINYELERSDLTSYLFRITYRSFFALVSAAMLLMALSFEALAQQVEGANTSAQENAFPILNNTGSHLSVNKDFDLNITEQRILKQDYKSSTSIGIGEAEPGGISLRAGTVVRANEVDILLHNIQGKVHFRSNWERLRQIIRSHPARDTVPK